MKVTITSKSANVNNHLKETVEKKMEKLGKYFADEIEVNVMLSEERNRKKVEATIRVKGMIFRAEDETLDFYEGLDKVVDKLAAQMTKFKSKLKNKHKENKEIIFDQWPEPKEEKEINITRKKKFDLAPMTVEEAVLQMEMLEHDFYIFLNMETDSVNLVYKRNINDYGLLETSY